MHSRWAVKAMHRVALVPAQHGNTPSKRRLSDLLPDPPMLPLRGLHCLSLDGDFLTPERTAISSDFSAPFVSSSLHIPFIVMCQVLLKMQALLQAESLLAVVRAIATKVVANMQQWGSDETIISDTLQCILCCPKS